MTELLKAIYRRQTDFWKKREFLGKFSAKNAAEKEKNAGKKYRRQNGRLVLGVGRWMWRGAKRAAKKAKKWRSVSFRRRRPARSCKIVFVRAAARFREKRKKEQMSEHPQR